MYCVKTFQSTETISTTDHMCNCPLERGSLTVIPRGVAIAPGAFGLRNSSLLLSHWHYWVALLAPTSCTFQRMSPGQNVAKITSTRVRTADCLHNYCHSQLLEAALVICDSSQAEWPILFGTKNPSVNFKLIECRQ